MIVVAALSGSPALLTLVVGHLAAGRPAMALLALCLTREAVVVLDAYLAAAPDSPRAEYGCWGSPFP